MAGNRSSEKEETMTPEQIALVQTSFAQVIPIADAAAALFYTRLFTLDPTLRALFHSDMQAQGRKLMSVLGIAVQGLSQPEKLLPLVQQLGERHRDYGVKDAHYATVGTALLWTLQQGLGEHYTPDVQAAWTSAYTLLADTMRAAAAAAATREAEMAAALAVAG
jgi:hemoglobin-like flavoprotein